MEDCFANHPMINMYKKAWENPGSFFSQNQEMMKNNPFMEFFANTQDMMKHNLLTEFVSRVQDMMKHNPMLEFFPQAKEMMNHMPWNNQASYSNIFTDKLKDIAHLKDAQKLTLENAQAMMRRQAEMIQKHAEELHKLMQYAISSSDPKETMNRRSEYITSTFDSLVSDFKELVEMHTKANMEAFDAASAKLSEQIHSHANTCGTSNAAATKPEEKVMAKAGKSKK